MVSRGLLMWRGSAVPVDGWDGMGCGSLTWGELETGLGAARIGDVEG